MLPCDGTAYLADRPQLGKLVDEIVSGHTHRIYEPVNLFLIVFRTADVLIHRALSLDEFFPGGIHVVFVGHDNYSVVLIRPDGYAP